MDGRVPNLVGYKTLRTLDLSPIETPGVAGSIRGLARRSLLGTPQPLSQQLFLAKPNASGPGQ
jgi:hypothetical protein